MPANCWKALKTVIVLVIKSRQSHLTGNILPSRNCYITPACKCSAYHSHVRQVRIYLCNQPFYIRSQQNDWLYKIANKYCWSKNKTKSFLFINYAMLSKRKKEILALEAPAVIISKSSIIKQFKNIYIKDARCS